MLGKLDEARQIGESVVARLPESADAHFLLGNVALESNDVPTALAKYDLVLAKNPRHADALRVSAELLCSLGRPDLAGARLKRLLELSGDQDGGLAELRMRVAGGCGL